MKKSYFLITIFFLILILPLLDSIFHFSPIKELFEKRQPAEKPQFSWNREIILNYPKNFEKFYDDNFGFRKTLIALNSKIMDNVFNQSPSERAVIGKDNWLYFNNYQSLSDVEGRLTYNPKILDKGITVLYNNWKECQKNNIKYLFVVAADKSSIYPEFLPDYIHPNSPTRFDQFLTRLKELHPDFPILDLRKIMLEKKEKEVIYYKTDTHWNEIGGYYGYAEIMNHLGLKPKSRSEFSESKKEKIHGDIADIMNLELIDTEYNFTPKIPFTYQITTSNQDRKTFHKPDFFTNSNSNLPILFSYKDSFMDDPKFLLADHFYKSYFINEFPCQIDIGLISGYKANFVIQEMWEGRMEEVLKSCK